MRNSESSREGQEDGPAEGRKQAPEEEMDLVDRVPRDATGLPSRRAIFLEELGIDVPDLLPDDGDMLPLNLALARAYDAGILSPNTREMIGRMIYTYRSWHHLYLQVIESRLPEA